MKFAILTRRLPLWRRGIRLVSSHHAALPIVISPEVQDALASKAVPVVSLESTIISHGLPYPRNIEMAREVEQVIRDNGAIPATCAFINGSPLVGLNDRHLETLALAATEKSIIKVSRRDIGYTIANRLNGGTTIALTMILSHLAGIKVFATGGLGGVHQDGHRTFDVSADLTELGRTPVAVVCAGPKLILDIQLTMEYLETQGVFVGTFNDDGRADVEVPGFYCRDSGVKSPYHFANWEEAARIVHHQCHLTGSVLCIPPPPESALNSEYIGRIIAHANMQAKQVGISGKQLTPFLLGKIAEDTQNKSVECNIEFVLNNARAAAGIAKQLLHLERKVSLAI